MFDDHFSDDLPEGMTWEEYLYFWHEFNTPPKQQHQPLPDPPIDPQTLPF